MKNLKYIVLLGALSIAQACSDVLELADPDKIGSDIALSTDENVKSVLLSGYDELSGAALFGGEALRNSELLGANGEVVWSGTFSDPSDVFNKEMSTVNADAADTWINCYQAIQAMNNVLSALEVVVEEDRAQVEGEALFIRGVAYFELIKFFGNPYSAGNAATSDGVPIMLVEDRNSVEPKPRSTVAEVYALILADLTTAESQVAEGPFENRATKEAAAAFLSRVYLQMGNYQGARDAADRVIAFAEAGNYELNGTYASAFNTGTTSEDIYDIPVSTVDGANSMQTYYASTAAGGRGDIEIQQAHLDLYEDGDDRLALFLEDDVTGETRTGKWVDPYGNVKIIRLAEIYLTRAEANQRLGTAVGDTPLNDVNLIRDRASLAPLGAVTLDDILLERRLELAHEGHRIHDAKRLQETITEGADSYTYDDGLLVFPIPQRERNVNANLTQNSAYTN